MEREGSAMSFPASTRRASGPRAGRGGMGRGAPTSTAEPAQTPAPRPLRFRLLQRSHPHRCSADLAKGSQGCSQPQPGVVRAKNKGIFPKSCPRAVQYLSGGVRRECGRRWPSRTSLAALRGPRVLSPHRLLGAAIFLPRPVRERGFRCVTSGGGTRK